MISEVTLAVILLIGAGLLTTSLMQVIAIDPGFTPDRLMTMEVELPGERYSGAGERATFFNALEQHARQLPDIERVGWISHVPLKGYTPSGRIVFEGRPDVEEEWGNADYRIVSADYFATMEIPLKRGRMFDVSDRRDGEHVLLVNDAFVRRYFPDEDPIGRRIQVAGFEPDQDSLPEWLTIVGIVGDVRHRGLDNATRPETYVTLNQRAGFNGWSMHLVVRSRGDASNPANALRHEVRTLDAGLPVTFDVVERIVSDSYSGRRFQSLLVGGFAIIGLLLAAIGLYGVIANSVSRRTGEFGIRMTLGAAPGRILALVLRQGLALVLVGTTTGLLGALALSRLMTGMLFGVTARDPWTFGAVVGVVSVVAIAACLIPARRASRVDPLVALRYD